MGFRLLQQLLSLEFADLVTEIVELLGLSGNKVRVDPVLNGIHDDSPSGGDCLRDEDDALFHGFVEGRQSGEGEVGGAADGLDVQLLSDIVIDQSRDRARYKGVATLAVHLLYCLGTQMVAT